MARADTIDPPTLKRLAESGLYAIKYGVESSDQEILETSGKRLDLKRMEETLQATHDLGIKSHLTFTFGLPGETWDKSRPSRMLTPAERSASWVPGGSPNRLTDR